MVKPSDFCRNIAFWITTFFDGEIDEVISQLSTGVLKNFSGLLGNLNQSAGCTDVAGSVWKNPEAGFTGNESFDEVGTQRCLWLERFIPKESPSGNAEIVPVSVWVTQCVRNRHEIWIIRDRWKMAGGDFKEFIRGVDFFATAVSSAMTFSGCGIFRSL